MKEHASKYRFENRSEQEIKQQIILTTNNNKLRRYAFQNPTLSLKDLLTYGKSLKEIDNNTEEMERKIHREEEINKVVKKLLGKNYDKGKRKRCSQCTSNKVCFVVEVIFLTTENAQQQEKIVINLKKLDTFHAVVEVNKKLTQEMILI